MWLAQCGSYERRGACIEKEVEEVADCHFPDPKRTAPQICRVTMIDHDEPAVHLQ